MTGHLVLSTLHTNDSISSATRLIDMGVEPFLAASSIRAIVAQRLVRKLCSECAVPHVLSTEEQAWMVQHLGDKAVESGKIMRPVGCHHCNQTGFRGRVGIFEMLKMDDQIADALRRADNSLFVERAKAQETYKPLLVSALEHVVNGVTTIQEAVRVAQQFESDVPQFEAFSGSDAEEISQIEEADDSASLALEALN